MLPVASSYTAELLLIGPFFYLIETEGIELQVAKETQKTGWYGDT